MKLNDSFTAGNGRVLLNLLTSGSLVQPAGAPAAAAFVPQRRHLSDVLHVLPVGPGIASIPRAVAEFIAGVQSSEGTAGPDNADAELELIRQPFAQVLASVTTSRQVLDDAALVAACIDTELREALRAAADTELARMLAQYAPLHTPAAAGVVGKIVEACLAFGKRWGAPRAVVVDHDTLIAAAPALVEAAPGAVQFDGDALRIGGVPVIGASLETPGQAIVTSGIVLQREGESVVSSRQHSDNFVSNKVTLLAATRLAAMGPSLRVTL